MIKFKKVLCNVLECTEYDEKGLKSSVKVNDNVTLREFEGGCHYDGKLIQENVPFIQLDYPFHCTYIPEKKFNFITKLILHYAINYSHTVIIDEKRFFTNAPANLRDKFVQVIE